MNAKLVLLFLLVSSIAFGQTKKVKPSDNIINNTLVRLESKPSVKQFLKDATLEFNLSPYDELKAKSVFESKNGWTRRRYTQFHKTIPVLGSSLIIHEKEGNIHKYSGTIMSNIEINIVPSITENALKQNIQEYIFNEDRNTKIKRTLKDYPILFKQISLVIIDKNFPQNAGEYSLAYEAIAETHRPRHTKRKFMVDANTGTVLWFENLICHVQSEGIAQTKYYGEQRIITDSISPTKFELIDPVRNIYTVNGKNPTNDSISLFQVFEDEDNDWDNANEALDEVAGDAHYCTSKYHDMMEEDFGWLGLDNEGGELISVVHAGGNYFLNAYWDGIATHYGDGDCEDYGPLTTLDIVGHEFAHAFTDYSSDLVYMFESGAINESISDIFGKALEYKNDEANFSWKIGKKFALGSSPAFRSLENPNHFNDPKYYKVIIGKFTLGGMMEEEFTQIVVYLIIGFIC